MYNSYLSKNIQNLVLSNIDNEKLKENDSIFSDHGILLQFKYSLNYYDKDLDYWLPHNDIIINNGELLKFYQENTKYQRIRSKYLLNHYHQNNTKDGKISIKKCYESDLINTNILPKELFINCLKMIESDSNNIILPYSIILSILEKVIRNIIYWKSGSQCIVGRMLRDLLDDPILSDVIGKETTLILKLLIGPPISLNLRNVVWHGFISPNNDELDLSLLLYIIHVTLTILHQTHQHKVLIKDSSESYSLNTKLTKYKQPSEDIQVPFVSLSKCQIETILKSTEFILPNRLNQWLSSLEHYYIYTQSPMDKRDCMDLYYSLVLLLPQLEHSLRVLFVKTNDQLSKEFLLADYTSFYTTLEIFLSQQLILSPISNGLEKQLQVPTTSKSYTKYENPKYSTSINTNSNNMSENVTFNNIMIVNLGAGTVGLLLDLFIYQYGPKLRDKIAHFEVDPNTIPLKLVELVWQVSLSLSLKFTKPKFLEDHKEFQNIISFTDEYKPMFHDKSKSLGYQNEFKGLVSQLETFCSTNLTESNSINNEVLQEYIGDMKYKPVISGINVNEKYENLQTVYHHYIDKTKDQVAFNYDLFPGKIEVTVQTWLKKIELISIKIVTEFKDIGYKYYQSVIVDQNSTKRSQNSFYKWIGITEHFILYLKTLVLHYHYYIFMEQYSNKDICYLEKLYHHLELIYQKVPPYEWDVILKLIYTYSIN
ncbi:hypothetical protein DLAC_01481 [Tieghemostelium lacteum]|uniref:DUF4209 domain-containing protein n=1 Tax=Tieghemostelium lacteum TaxID=361077 RepID=A0A152A5I3_TIELA|nr:hypothetical protein DLAC_01481 [Tieghemostelium lacteum]|eukprot:KYR01494.1 hypothetical protein DLAC_01481 [Tieghemostelium lacteum]